MAEFVREDVEIQRIWRMVSVGKPMGADFHEAVAGIGVVETRQDGDLELSIVRREMPFDPPAEVAFPDVQPEPHRAEHVRFGKFRRSRKEMIEMTFSVRKDRLEHRPFPGRKIKMGGTQGSWIHAVRETLADRPDEAHPFIGRARTNGARRLGHANRLRRPFRMHIRRLWVKPEPYAPLATPHLCRLVNVLTKQYA